MSSDSDASFAELSRRSGDRRQHAGGPAIDDRRQSDRRAMTPGLRGLLQALLAKR